MRTHNSAAIPNNHGFARFDAGEKTRVSGTSEPLPRSPLSLREPMSILGVGAVLGCRG